MRFMITDGGGPVALLPREPGEGDHPKDGGGGAPPETAHGCSYPFPAQVDLEAVPPLLTDGGPHPAAAWAAHVAEWYLSPAPGVKGRSAEARQVHVDLVRSVLEPVFERTIADERAHLAAEGGMRLDAMVDRADEACAATDAIIAASKGAITEEYWARPELGRLVAIEIAHHLRSADFVQRSWWADRHPMNNAAAAFRARHHPGA